MRLSNDLGAALAYKPQPLIRALGLSLGAHVLLLGLGVFPFQQDPPLPPPPLQAWLSLPPADNTELLDPQAIPPALEPAHHDAREASADNAEPPQETVPQPKATPTLIHHRPEALPQEKADSTVDRPENDKTALPNPSTPPEISSPALPTQRPQPLYRVMPRYPAGVNGVSGRVVLRLSISETGAVAATEVLSSEPKGIFEAESMRAFQRARFSAARIGDKAVKSQFTVDIRFEDGESIVMPPAPEGVR